MIKTRKLTAEGIAAATAWLETIPTNMPPRDILEGSALTEVYGDYEIDPSLQFSTRLEFGIYLNQRLSDADFHGLMSPDSDGFWSWLAFIYFSQLTSQGIRRAEHYIVARKGSAGSLAYRHAVRTSFELVHIHGRYAEICLRSSMHTFGDMTEQLASRQAIAHNRAFFQTASDLYLTDGKLRRGASSKPKKQNERKAGDRTGLGSVRRLAVALQRLDLTYDTIEMRSDQLRTVLPNEFAKWASR